VFEWFSKNKIHNEIQKLYSKLNGDALCQVLQARKDNPALLEGQLLANKNLKKSDINHFYKCLDQLNLN
jgi:hypothetical protein